MRVILPWAFNELAESRLMVAVVSVLLTPPLMPLRLLFFCRRLPKPSTPFVANVVRVEALFLDVGLMLMLSAFTCEFLISTVALLFAKESPKAKSSENPVLLSAEFTFEFSLFPLLTSARVSMEIELD